jgi:cell division protein FtsX
LIVGGIGRTARRVNVESVILRRLILVLTVAACALAGATPQDDKAKEAYAQLLEQVRLERLQETFRTVSSYGSRIAGSRAEGRTIDLAEREFQALGMKTRRQPFQVTVPDPEARGTLSVGGQKVAVWPMWPNLARTSTCDVSGKLIYGGTGRLEELKGLEVRGSIVLMEFNSGPRWRNAAKLGAKAIVFIQPDEMPRSEAEAKFVAVPLDVPRFYLPLKAASPVLSAATSQSAARLVCKQDWKSLPSANLIAELPGTDPAAQSERVVLFAYSDAMSVVPGLAPGADSIGGMAALLEMARVWKARPHPRPITFVLSGGHHLALEGVRQYVESLFKTNAPATLLTITLDLASGSRSIGSYGEGWFFEYRGEPKVVVSQMSRLFRNHADKIAEVANVSPARLILTDAVNQGDSRTWKNNIPGKFGLDCEPLLNASVPAVTFATIEDGRERTDTPLDTLDKVNLANIHRQAQTVACMLHHALNDTSSVNETSDYRVPLEPAKPRRMSLYGGFATVGGQVVNYDPQKSFVPDIPIENSVAIVRGRQKTMMGVRGDMVQLTQGPQAEFTFFGLAPATSYWEPFQTPTRIAGFHSDPVTGKIDYAASLGFFGDFSYPTHFMLKVTERRSPLVVFPCASVAIYDLVDPQDLTALADIRVLDANTDSQPSDYGIFSPPSDQRLSPEIEDSQVIFLPKGLPFKLLGGSSIGEIRLILTNSSLGDETGKGYFAPGGPTDQGRASIATGGLFPDTALNTARDIAAINHTRLERFRKYRIISAGIDELHQQAEEEILQAEQAQKGLNWAEADRHARAAWGFALRAHPVIQKTANDVVNGVVFYLFLLLPFSYFMERLIFANRLLTKQLGAVVAIFLGSFVLLRLIHPAFEIVSNPSMIFVAFVMGSLSLIVITFVLGKFESSLRMIKQAQSGVTEVDIRRGSVAMAAFNLGVSNMRRRKARTFLTTLTLVVMTFIVLSFTSIVSELQLNEYPSDNEARYSGILIRNPGLEPLQLTTFRQIQSEFSGRATVARRTYYYGADIGDAGILTLQRADRVAEVRAMLGLEPEETRITRPQDALLPGGRWFRPGEQNVMILPANLALTLKVDPSEVGKAKVKYAGTDYTIIGIVDPSVLRGALDLDGDSILPPDFSLSRKEQQESGSSNQAFRKYIRLDPSAVFLLPAETSLGLGADLRSVGIEFDDPARTRAALDALMPRLRLNLYAAVQDEGTKQLQVRQFSVYQASKGTGLVLIIVQLVIASSFVFSTMLASVYERTKEISIFSSIGLAPNHIAMLFFAESLVYGVLGAVFGYYLAQGTAKFIVATGALPGLTLNFSSTSAVMSAGIVMGVVLLSTIYPSRKAAQIAAPAMNEEVFETDPEGDEWTLPLPFSIGAVEAAPVMEFLGEWLRAYEEYTIGDFVTSGTRIWATQEAGGHAYHVGTTTWLAPYDLGVSQQLRLTARPSKVDGIYALDLVMTRLAGDPENWPTVNRRFLGNVRRQFLTWRTLTAEQRATFEARAEETFEPLEPVATP